MDNPEKLATYGKHRETGNIEYTKRRKPKQKHNTICVEHHYAQVNNSV